MNLKQWNQLQIDESKSELNIYYFGLHYKRPPKEGREGEVELLLYYIEHGAKIFSELHKGERDERPNTTSSKA